MSTTPHHAQDSFLAVRRLPIELVHEILLHVAQSSIHNHRTWVVNIALLCQDAYRLVKGLLYHTMVITSDNVDRLCGMSEDISCSRVFSSVRSLSIISDCITFASSDDHLIISTGALWNPTRFVELFVSARHFDVPFHVLEVLAKHPAFRPTRLAVRYRPYIVLVSGSLSRTRSLSCVTHLEGYLPHHLPANSPREWVSRLLGVVPALTHIAFDIIDLQPDSESTNWSPLVEFPPLNIIVLEEVLRTALEHKQIQVVALDVAGERRMDSEVISNVVRSIGDPRIRVWLDTRDLETWADEENASADDAWADRDVWTEARCCL